MSTVQVVPLQEAEAAELSAAKLERAGLPEQAAASAAAARRVRAEASDVHAELAALVQRRDEHAAEGRVAVSKAQAAAEERDRRVGADGGHAVRSLPLAPMWVSRHCGPPDLQSLAVASWPSC